jgi:hypothetical protein
MRLKPIPLLIYSALLLILGIWLLTRRGNIDPTPTESISEKNIPPRGYVCYRGTPVIDGRLDQPVWDAVPWTDDFVDIEGNVKPKPRLRTRAKMLWDDEYFYVGAELTEPHIWGSFTKHDSYIFTEDPDFEVFIDPDGDSHEYAEFEINALNTGWDLLLTRPYKDGGSAIDSWEMPGLKSKVHIEGTINDPSDTDRFWSVVIAFPWKVLKQIAHRDAPPKDGDQWRVNFSRVEWQFEIVEGKYRRIPKTAENNWVWSPQGAINMHQPETWGYVQFSTQAPGTATFRPDPSGPARYALHRIYYAQRDYREKHNRWAGSLAELGLPRPIHESFVGAPRIMTTDDLFQSTLEFRLPSGGTQKVHIRQDARVWVE